MATLIEGRKTMLPFKKRFPWGETTTRTRTTTRTTIIRKKQTKQRIEEEEEEEEQKENIRTPVKIGRQNGYIRRRKRIIRQQKQQQKQRENNKQIEKSPMAIYKTITETKTTKKTTTKEEEENTKEDDVDCQFSKTCKKYIEIPTEKKERIKHISELKAGSEEHYRKQHWKNSTYIQTILEKTIGQQEEKNIRILEVGIGTGHLLKRIEEIRQKTKKKIQIDGLEIAKAMIEKAKKNTKENVQYIEGDAFEYESKEKYDLIILDDLLIHYKEEEAETLMKALTINLKKTGNMLVMENIHPTLTKEQLKRNEKATLDKEKTPMELHEQMERICDVSKQHVYKEDTLKSVFKKASLRIIDSGHTRVTKDFELYCNIVPKPPRMIREAHMILVKDFQRDSPPTGLFPFYQNVTTYDGSPWEKLFFYHQHAFYILELSELNADL